MTSRLTVDEPTPCSWMPNVFTEADDRDGRLIHQLRALCYRCPVLEDCTTYVLAASEIAGFAAGMTPRQQAVARRLTA